MSEVTGTELRLLQLTRHGGSGLELPSLSWRRSSLPPSHPSLPFSFPSSSPVRIIRNCMLPLFPNSSRRIVKVKKKKWRRNIHLLVLVREKSLENFTVGNNWMPAHPGHPALQSLHTHLNELLFKSSWNRPQKQMTLYPFFFFFFNPLCFIISCGVECSPVTCLSGKEGIGIAEPNLSSNLSYSQSKCLYL